MACSRAFLSLLRDANTDNEDQTSSQWLCSLGVKICAMVCLLDYFLFFQTSFVLMDDVNAYI